MCKKKTFFLVACIICSLLLSSCGKQKQYAVKYDDFRYNNIIGWDSSYSDIVSAYGTPDEVKLIDEYFTATYNHQSVCGYDGFSVSFEFYYGTGALHDIMLRYELPTYGSNARKKIKNVHQAVLDALVSKYGPPSQNSEYESKITDFLHYYVEWKDQIEDTTIALNTQTLVGVSINNGKSDNKGTVCEICYRCWRDKTERIQQNDVFPLTPSPLPTASPTPIPTPTINTNGI